MIEEHFGLERTPFRLSTDVGFYYESDPHRRAMAHLRYGLRQGEGFVVITGEPGVGKTIVVERLLMDLDETETMAGTLLPDAVSAEALPVQVLAAFDRQPIEGADPMRSLHDFLRDERERGRKASLLVDEAQRLDDDALEALRLVSNLSHDGEALLQLCLIGQTSLRSALYRAEMEQFRQRVVASYHLPALSAADTEAYIRHRLRIAGWTGEDVFTPEAAGSIYRETKGVPQRINAVCSQVLMKLALDGKSQATAEDVHAALSDAEPAEVEAEVEVEAGERREPLADAVSAADVEAAASAEEEAEAERTLALLTASLGSMAAAGPPPRPRPREDAPTAKAPSRGTSVPDDARAGGRTVSVKDINAAILEIQAMPHQRARGFTSPDELMSSAQRPANDESRPAPLEDPAAAADPEEVRPTEDNGAARAALESFLAETTEALDSLRESLALIRRETDAMDARRRARRDRIDEDLERQAKRLHALRIENASKEA
ncbi:ExeA family protein [Parvularcula dongshanensis]|uniref:Type II secretory pathway predicted ATPase ExeA n=1 Tax=Parvularcula dongshanensis TaxID=1173995 RepID=A0A840I4L0_9PROT|nr:AAA family ATPase [Parvularcula dongshanensis]MBB4659789.1 type II secretory pathway predicted ATPase ExeA [Parvularcula dongshanensis]